MARLPSPLQQGDLDGLCGAYAVVNAVTRLLHDRGFTREDANRLFKRLCHALHRRQKMPQAVWRGTHIEDVDAMLQTVQRFVRESFDLRLVVSRPFAAETVKRRDRFFNVLSAAFNADDRRKVAILGLDKPGFHWTNVTDVGISRLSELKDLANLDLRSTSTSQAAIDRLRAQLPGCKVLWSYRSPETPIPDGGPAADERPAEQ